MRRFVTTLSVLLGATCLQVVGAQGFTGTFVSPEAAFSVSLQQAPDGTLTGVVSGPSGQFALQGQASGPAAYGVVASQQGPLGFQAALAADGGTLTMELYQMSPDGQATPAGPPLTLVRSGGAPGQALGAAPGQPTGGTPGQVQGGFPGQTPGGFPQQAPGGYPGQAPAGFPGQAPVPPGAAAGDWNGTFVGDAGALVLTVQGAQGNYGGVLQAQGQRYQFQAHLDDATLHGAFMAGGAQYEFWADRDGAYVVLWLGDATYHLEPAANPGWR